MVERRLIGTIRREHLDQTRFWNQGDLERKLDSYKVYYNAATPDWSESRRLSAVALLRIQSQTLTHIAGDHMRYRVVVDRRARRDTSQTYALSRQQRWPDGRR